METALSFLLTWQNGRIKQKVGGSARKRILEPHLPDLKYNSLSDSGNPRYLVLDAIRAVGRWKLGMERKRFHERATTDEYEVRFLTSYNINTNKAG